jgi:hypothetical protein
MHTRTHIRTHTHRPLEFLDEVPELQSPIAVAGYPVRERPSCVCVCVCVCVRGRVWLCGCAARCMHACVHGVAWRRARSVA